MPASQARLPEARGAEPRGGGAGLPHTRRGPEPECELQTGIPARTRHGQGRSPKWASPARPPPGSAPQSRPIFPAPLPLARHSPRLPAPHYPSRPAVRRKPSTYPMAAARGGPVELGFAEAAPAWRLRSEQFPSKVGGRPAWLGAAGLPGPKELACALCGRPLAFLLQLYAPVPSRADAFHRGLFVFCCRASPCCAGLRGEGPSLAPSVLLGQNQCPSCGSWVGPRRPHVCGHPDVSLGVY